MREIILVPKDQPRVGLQAEVIKPEEFAGKDIEEIKNLEVFCGNRKSKLGDFFEVSGSKADDAGELRIVIDGSVSRTKRIGEEMGAGEIQIKGDVDMYVGAKMKGGKIVVEGNADSFAGQQMRGGELLIKGNVKDYLGASYRGDWRGMKGGSIVVEGNAGSELGEFMMGGRIAVKGDCGPFAGVHMKKGLIVIGGSTPGRVGAEMVGGNIVVMGEIESMLPSFMLKGEEENIEIDGERFEGRFEKYSGDHAERNAKGTLYKKIS
jgi:formylmethanofuran dehydrogenase subunit C